MDLIIFTRKVEQMRQAQVLYFQQIAEAKKSGLSKHWAIATITLSKAKKLENEVDVAVAEIIKQQPLIP
jgi:hypothetical protein